MLRRLAPRQSGMGNQAATSCPLSRPRRDEHVLDCPGCPVPRMLTAEVKSESLRSEIGFNLDLISETLLEREECVFSMNRQLVEGWGQFLSGFSWDWFVTLTFRG